MRISPLLLTVFLVAATPALATGPASAQASAADSATDGERDARDARDRDTVDRHCLKQTGTRIKLRPGARSCAAFAGRVWTRHDLDRTGQVDIADALRMLDPAIR